MISQKRTSLAIDFLIVGGSVAGLVCAIALRRVGHRVIVLEKDKRIEPLSGGFRMTPNLSKILFHWGLEAQVRKIALRSAGIIMMLQESGDTLGIHQWDEEMLREARGEYFNVHHSSFCKLLYDTAVSLGADIRFNSLVDSVDGDECTVTLASGAVLQADVIIGADGVAGITRQHLLESGFMETPQTETPPNFVMYNAIIPKAAIMQDPELAYFYNQSFTSMYAWFGHNRLVLAFPLPNSEFAMHVYSPPDNCQRPWTERAPLNKLQEALGQSEPRLRKLGKLATRATCVTVSEHSELEEWVHDSGRLIIIGEAAHHLPPGGQQMCAMTVEDGAVLAKLFSHLRTHDQISNFLYAFQDIRQPRCGYIGKSEAGNLAFMSMPPSEAQQQRDQHMKALHQSGQSPMGAAEDQWEEMKLLYGYDAEDEADNWWIEWGLLRERAQGVVLEETYFGIQQTRRQQRSDPASRWMRAKRAQ